RKKIKNEDLIEGCREAFKAGMSHVKLYFLCGLPGERHIDLDGIVDLAEQISAVGKQVTGRYKEVIASVSNFVPKPHTPYQWNGMQSREYFRWAGEYLHRRKRNKNVKVKQHDIETSLLEGILTRGDRRVAPALLEAWKPGARLRPVTSIPSSRRRAICRLPTPPSFTVAIRPSAATTRCQGTLADSSGVRFASTRATCRAVSFRRAPSRP